MSNVVKGYQAAVEDEDKLVIDSNSQVADRLRLLGAIFPQDEANGFSSDGFMAGLDADMIEGAPEDGEGEEGGDSSNVIKAEPATPPPAMDMGAMQAQADQILEDARAQADQIIQEAVDQAEAQRASIYEDARQQGHNEGYNQGLAEVDSMRNELAGKEQELMDQYEQMVMELEPALVDMLSDIYGHIIGVEMSEHKELIFHLLQQALQNTDTTANLMVHVSKDDYEYISTHKSELFDGIPGEDNTDIVPDVTLGTGQCMIDTGSGIFDCSIGTELEGLRKQLLLLSYQRSTDEEA